MNENRGNRVASLKPPPDVTNIQSVKEAWYGNIGSSVHKMGFEYGTYCFLGIDQRSVEVISSKNAIAWVKHYIVRDYVKHDPAAECVFKKEQLIWNRVDEKNKIVQKIMNERRDFGMRSGITVPIFNKVGQISSWFVLSTKSSQKYLDVIIDNPLFNEKIYDIHISLVSYSLSKLTNLSLSLCNAIVLSHYTQNMNLISEKTGFLVSDLNRLYSHLYLRCPHIDFFCLDIQDETVKHIGELSDYLKTRELLSYRFSKREHECIELIKKGLTAKQAARVMKISPRTYEWYTNEIRYKSNCRNQRELISKLNGGF